MDDKFQIQLKEDGDGSTGQSWMERSGPVAYVPPGVTRQDLISKYGLSDTRTSHVGRASGSDTVTQVSVTVPRVLGPGRVCMAGVCQCIKYSSA